jgi:thiol-disulfide isomerase/thioredoxin
MFNLSKNIFLFIFLFIPIISYDHWTQVTDETFNWETTYDNVNWLLFFTNSFCKKCLPVYDLLNKTMKKYTDKRIGFVYIDTIKCPWLANRFNVTYLPKIILLEDDLMYNFHSNFNQENIMNFIDKKKPISSASFKPKGAKLKYIYKTYGSLLSHKINVSMQYILDKLHIPLKWNKYFTIFFAFIFLIIFITLFIFIIIFCCRIITGICCCRLCIRKKESKKEKEKEIKIDLDKKDIKEKIE